MTSLVDKSLLEKVTYNSVAMQKVREIMDPLVQSAVPLLFWEESGSGAAFYARAIHTASREWEFLRIGCIELEGEEKIKEQVFGSNDQQGWLEKADKGTILFRQLEGSSPTVQKILLQLLRLQSVDGRIEFSRMGCSDRVEVNVRFIYSLAGNLDSLLQEEILSHDLVDLIKRKGKIIQIPPLRERKEDIIDIAKNFFEALNRDRTSTITFIDKKAQKLLTNYYWPGNIDELKRVMTNIFSQYPEITTISEDHLPEHIKNPQKIEYKFSFKLKNKEQFTGTFRSDSFRVEKKDKAKIRININDLLEIIRVENDQFMPPKFEHFVFKLKDGTQAAGKFLDQKIKVETASKAFNQINVQDLYSVVLS